MYLTWHPLCQFWLNVCQMLRCAHLVMQYVHMVTNTYAATVAANVNRAMSARGVTVVALSEAARIPRSTLTRRLSDPIASPLTVAEVERIAVALNMPVSSITSTAPIAA